MSSAALWLVHSPAQPLFAAANDVLDAALRVAGYGRADVHVAAWSDSLATRLLAERPAVIVALGIGAAQNLISNPPSDGIQALRGYLWDAPLGRVLTTVHPSDVLREWTPWRALLDFDMKRAAAEVSAGAPPLATRVVRVCTAPRDAEELRSAMLAAPLTAVDIENTHDLQLACVGFAPTSSCAWVIPAHEAWQLATIRELCENSRPKVLQNGQYDRFFLRRFAGIELRNQVFDIMLAWHALNPELAGKKASVGNRKATGRRTVKSLKFLASIYTRDAWWKEYSFTSEDERYRLCGKDCCVTLDIAQRQTIQLAGAV